MSAVENICVVNETSKKTTMKEKRQKRLTIQARIKYRQLVLKAFRKHLNNGTFPKRMKSIKPYPKMGSPESQAIVNAACDQVQCVILDQIILDEEKKLVQDQEHYQSLQEQKLRAHVKTLKNPTVAQLQKELTELQAKYSEVCKTLENTTKRENATENTCKGLEKPYCVSVA